MFTSIAFSESVNPAGAYVNLAGVPDQHVLVNGDQITVPSDYNKLLGAMACVGAGGAHARIVAPSLREIGLEYIAPVVLAIAPAGEHLHSVTPQRSIDLKPAELLTVEEDSTPGGAQQHAIVLWLGNNEIVPVTGKIRTINFVLNTALVLDTWVNNVPALAEELPVGNYKIVGMRLEIANGIAARISVPGNWHRPGIPISGTAGVNDSHLFRFGNMGEFLTFNTTNLFSIDVLGAAAVGAANYQGFLDLIEE